MKHGFEDAAHGFEKKVVEPVHHGFDKAENFVYHHMPAIDKGF